MLTALAIEKLKPKEKPYKVSDGNQLSLLVEPAGAKLWRLRYTFDGKEKMLSLGSYPEVSLADARGKRDEALALLANGINPSDQKKQDRLVAELAGRNTFGAIAEEYLQRLEESGVSEGTVNKNRWLLLKAADSKDTPLSSTFTWAECRVLICEAGCNRRAMRCRLSS